MRTTAVLQATQCGSAALLGCLLAASVPAADDARRDPSDLFGMDLDELMNEPITARKRVENAQDVPISVTVLSSERLAALQARDLGDTVSYVPNLHLDYDGNALNSWGIRGIVSTTRNAGQESGVGVYVDGVYVGRPAGFNVALADVDQVEVLRGPQGTLYGRNTIGGAVNITTRRPEDHVEAYGKLSAGNFSRLDVQAGVSGPIVPGSLNGKVSAFRLGRDGYVDDARAGSDAYLDDDRWGLRGALHWSVTDATEIALRADYSDQDNRQVFGLTREPQLNAFAPDWFRPGLASNLNDPSFERIQAGGGSLTVTWLSPSGYELTSITAHRVTDFDLVADDDAGPFTLTYSRFRDDSDMISQELRLASPVTRSIDYLVGVYYLDQQVSAARLTGFEEFPADDTGIFSSTRVDTRAAAIFSNLNFHASPRVTLGLGLRYTREEKDSRFSQVERGRPGVPEGALLPAVTFTPQQEDAELSGDATLTWKLADETTTYATVRRGVKSGGFQTDIITFTSESLFVFEPESAVSYELGLKSLLFDNRVRLNAAVFRTDYRDVQVGQGVDLGFTTTNAGSSTINGAEVELLVRATDRLTLDLTTGLLDHQYDRFASCAENLDCHGNKLQFAPDWTLAAAADYVWPLAGGGQLGLHLDVTSRDTVESDAFNDPDTRNERYTLLNARLGYRSASGRLGVHLWSRNLTDKRYDLFRWKYPVTPIVFAADDATVTGLQAIPGVPRTFGVELEWRL